MTTREMIKAKALELFNINGISNVTLREVAKALDKSYGNITYHYNTREQLVEELYLDMVAGLKGVTNQIMASKSLFHAIIDAPNYTFDISMNYLFLFKDFVEIKRNFPTVASKAERSNKERKKVLIQSLILLREHGILQSGLDNDDLDYLMELSGAIRTFFFLDLSPGHFKRKDLKVKYIESVNRLLIPYLSAKGKKLYKGMV